MVFKLKTSDGLMGSDEAWVNGWSEVYICDQEVGNGSSMARRQPQKGTRCCAKIDDQVSVSIYSHSNMMLTLLYRMDIKFLVAA